MKRYLVFGGDWGLGEGGGWDDFRESFDTAGAAEAYVLSQGSTCDWWQVVDVQTGSVRLAQRTRYATAATFSNS